MPKWIPETIWRGHNVFVIGGGASLKDFDWTRLQHKLTIGCNDAYTLGEEVCKICVFGDIGWFRVHQHSLSLYKGTVFTNVPQLFTTKIPWLWSLPRKASGFHVNELGWNENTGAAAINLALILGAKRVFLLGFDMCLSKNSKSNWHDNSINKRQSKLIYQKFLSHEKRMAADLVSKFPDTEVINITKQSALNIFPKVDFDEFWKKERKAG